MLNDSVTIAKSNRHDIDTISQKTSIHAILIEKYGGIFDLWLPTKIEGRYVFPVAEEYISIIAEDSKWKACIANDGYFSFQDPANPNKEIRTNEIILHSNALYIAYWRNKILSLYIEDGWDDTKIFRPYYLEKNTDIFIGREITCDIQYISKFVSRDHAVLRYHGEHLSITDRNSTNGVYVNGKKIHSATLALGDVVHILGLCIVVGAGYIKMNNTDKCRITSRKVYPLDVKKHLTHLPSMYTANDFHYREARGNYELTKKIIEIDLPPPALPKTKIPLALRLGNNALMGGQAIFSGNYIGAISSLFLPALTQGISEADRKEYETKRVEGYHKYLEGKTQEIADEITSEENFLRVLFPKMSEVLHFTKERSRLWERGKRDSDFLTVSLGTGTLPMVAEKKYLPQKFQIEQDTLEKEMYALAEKPSLLHDVPITVSLREDWVLGIIGFPIKILQMVTQLIAYVAITHAYDEVKMVLIAPESLKKEFAFTKYLKHFWDNEQTVRFVATNSSDIQAISKYFRDMDTQSNNPRTISYDKIKNQPAYIVFALDQNLFEQSEILKELFQDEKYRGFSFIPAFQYVPKECGKYIALWQKNKLIDLNRSDTTDTALEMDTVDPDDFKNSMNGLAKINLPMELNTSFSLPSMVTFLDMYGVGKVEHLNPFSRWERNNPVKSLSVPIGIGTDGKLFTLDLHEKQQGPHGLVAGMTGSGKSEFIITYILSLAVNFSPDEVAFVLIDYKGGGLADAFVDPKRGIHLPHVVATITNLDGSAIQRSLISIQSELNRRQECFKRAKSQTGEGTMDIYDYQRLYRNKQVSEPMPHIFIISDEFAELKKQQPEFMDSLISAARIGRSLGVHLILATQKPGGVVNDQIWSNTKFRACLKVQDRSDSMEMLKRPDAADLKNTGRFYLQVGYNEFFALGQSAWCGAEYIPQEKMVQVKDGTVEFVDNTGQVIFKAKEKKPAAKAESKQIVAIVKYLSDLAKRENIVPKSLWCTPLSANIAYHDLAKNNPIAPEKGISALIGLVDDPERQEQKPLFLDLLSFHHMALCGFAGSGKSTFFKTMLYSLVMNYSPKDINFYILDLSGGILSIFRNMPHCGAYLTKENESDFDRMLALIQEIVDERKKMFAKSEIYSYNDYVKMQKLPLVMVIIDGWTNITEFAKGQQYSLSISKNMRDAANYGVRFLFSVNHLNEFSAKVSQELDYKIALQAKDKFDYNDILHLRNAFMPPEITGRGICAMDGRALEYQVAVPYCNLDVQQQTFVLKEELHICAKQLQQYQAARCLPIMDDKLEYANFCNSFANDRIPLGFSMQSMKEIAMPLQQLHTAGMYFGNPIGVKPVIFNILSAFRRENADAFILRRTSGTIFDRNFEEKLGNVFDDHYKVVDTNSENVTKLFNWLLDEYIPQYRVPCRNEFCELHGIPATDKGRTVKAAKYIRSQTTPLVILFESLADLMAVANQKIFAELFSGKLKGFNIYFIGCFYPADEDMSVNPIFRSFSKDDFALLFGGQFHKQWMTVLPSDYKRMEKINPNYNRFIMKYRGECHRMIMPCGELAEANVDPDEQEII